MSLTFPSLLSYDPVQDALARFTKAETLDKHNKYTCEGFVEA
jgi:hypothetical protein